MGKKTFSRMMRSPIVWTTIITVYLIITITFYAKKLEEFGYPMWVVFAPIAILTVMIPIFVSKALDEIDERI